MLLNAQGKLVVAPGEARINLDNDFCRYYRKLVMEYYGATPQELHLPMYGAHITILAKKIHQGIDTTCLEDYNGDTVDFMYDHEIRKGGTKFTTYYAYVECPFAEFVKRKVGIIDPPSFLGLHICVCNNKSKWTNWQD